jgi:hypothetical protein
VWSSTRHEHAPIRKKKRTCDREKVKIIVSIGREWPIITEFGLLITTIQK